MWQHGALDSRMQEPGVRPEPPLELFVQVRKASEEQT